MYCRRNIRYLILSINSEAILSELLQNVSQSSTYDRIDDVIRFTRMSRVKPFNIISNSEHVFNYSLYLIISLSHVTRY